MSFQRVVLIYFWGDVAVRAVGIITAPLLTRLLAPNEYGGLSLLYSLWGVAAIAAFAGMDSAYPYFRANRDYIEKQDHVLSTATGIAAAALCLTSATVLSLEHAFRVISRYSGLSSMAVSVYIIGAISTQLTYWLCYTLRYMQQPIAYIQISIFGRVIVPLFAIPVAFLSPSELRLEAYLFSSALLGFVVLTWAYARFCRTCGAPFRSTALSRDLLRPMLRFGGALVPPAVLNAAAAAAPLLLLGVLRGPSEAAVYAIAAVFAAPALVVGSSLGLAIDPMVASWAANNEFSRRRAHLRGLTILAALIFGTLAVLLLFWAPLLTSLFFPEAYRSAGLVSPWLVLAGGLSVLGRVAVATTVAANNVRLPTVAAVLGLLAASLTAYTAIPAYGALGAAWTGCAFAVSTLIFWTLIDRYKLRKLNIHWGPSQIILSIAAFSVFVSQFIIRRDVTSIIDLFWLSGAVMTGSLVMALAAIDERTREVLLSRIGLRR
jgi:O-antigen/teichoic acid export membrane protein